MLLAVIYCHLNRNINEFQSKLCDLLMKLKREKIHYLICGNINIDTLHTDNNKIVKRLDQYGLIKNKKKMCLSSARN